MTGADAGAPGTRAPAMDFCVTWGNRTVVASGGGPECKESVSQLRALEFA